MRIEQIVALSSVACSEVFSTFSAAEALSIREVAGFLDRSPASVGEQVVKLVNCGLLMTAGERKRRSRTEVLYVYCARTTNLIWKKQTPEALDAYLGRFKGQMRLAERELAEAQRTIIEQPEYRHFLVYQWNRLYLTPKSAEKVQQAVASLNELIHSLSEEPPTNPDDDTLVRATFTTMLLPSLSASKRARKKSE
jgi:predicted transcriptional regulator